MMHSQTILPPLFDRAWLEPFLWRDGYRAAIAEEMALRATAPVDIAVTRLGSALRQTDDPYLRGRIVDALHLLTSVQIRIAARLTTRVLPYLAERPDDPESALQAALAASGLTTLAAIEAVVAQELGTELREEVHALLEVSRQR
jgi:hypothetical protein